MKVIIIEHAMENSSQPFLELKAVLAKEQIPFVVLQDFVTEQFQNQTWANDKALKEAIDFINDNVCQLPDESITNEFVMEFYKIFNAEVSEPRHKQAKSKFLNAIKTLASANRLNLRYQRSGWNNVINIEWLPALCKSVVMYIKI